MIIAIETLKVTVLIHNNFTELQIIDSCCLNVTFHCSQPSHGHSLRNKAHLFKIFICAGFNLRLEADKHLWKILFILQRHS